MLGGITMTSSYAQDSNIPNWIKNTAGWWANGEVEDAEFFSLIEFLVDKEIITIPNNRDDSQRVQELENELSNLKSQTIIDIQNAYEDGFKDGYADKPVEQSIVIENEQVTNEVIQDSGIFILINDSDSQQTFKKGDSINLQFFVSNVNVVDDASPTLIITSVLDGNIIRIDERYLSTYEEGQYRDGWGGLPNGLDSCLDLCQMWISEIGLGTIGIGSVSWTLNSDSFINTTMWEVKAYYGESSESIRFLVEEN